MKRLFAWLIVFCLIFSVSALSESVPYRVNLSGDTPIYAGPGEKYGYEMDIGQNGVFTIVEEAVGEDRCLWGKLKSGAGWVRLSDTPFMDFHETPYTWKIPAWVSIFDGPGYDYAYKKPVGRDGVYTIVEEQPDMEGNLWGRLKSGAGWVDLTYLEYAKTLPVIVSFADDELLESGEYIFRRADASEYSVKIAVRANELLQNVCFTSQMLGEAFWETDEILYSAKYMQTWRPLVIEVTFWGDMTTFGFDFTDANGTEHHYLINISGRNGSLYVEEHF